jgi:G3E family GTPase
VIGGYLGAGKTTLVNHLLREAQSSPGGLRIAVLVNDFGELPIDADLIESQGDGVIGIAGGCVCCSIGSDLVEALQAMAARVPAPQQVLVETSGVALPGAVARTVGLLPAFRLDAVVVLADAGTLRARAVDRYVGDTVTRQLAEADVVLLNKADLVDAAQLDALEAWLHDHAPSARVLCAERAKVAPEFLLGAMDSAANRVKDTESWAKSGGLREVAVPPAKAAFESATWRPAGALDVSALAGALCDPALGVLRAKGRLRDADGTLKTLQVVGSRFEVSQAAEEGGSAALVCIGVAGRFERRAIDIVVSAAASRPELRSNGAG